MPSLKAIRTRISSVKSTQKITRAMKLVSAARLRRAQDAIVGARPYANALADAIVEVALRAGADAHPLLDRRVPERLTMVPLTSDRGLAGGFNANVFRALQRFTDALPIETLQRYERELYAFVDARHSELWGEIRTKGSDKSKDAWNSLTTRMKSVLGEFGKEFAPDVQGA